MSKARDYIIAVIPGDGIGLEVMPEAVRVLAAAGDRFGFRVTWEEHDWSCDRYLRTGKMMPDDGLLTISAVDAILLGAVGSPKVPDHVSLWGLLIPIRRAFHQYVNLRPVRQLDGIEPRVATPKGKRIDYVIVRENNEGEYSEVGGRINAGTDHELVLQESVFTRRGVDRVMRFAFDLASGRPAGHVTSATKSNGIIHTMPFWDERFSAIASAYPQVGSSQLLVDNLAAQLVLSPDRFDVIVASNLFGDILSDLGAATVGGLGLAPSANLNPEREFPSMFEPVHGSAPDIAGTNSANPVAQTWSVGMMLDHLGETRAARAVMHAIERSVQDSSTRTADIGGSATTSDVGRVLVGLVADQP